MLENSIETERKQISHLLNSLVNDFFAIDKKIDIFSGLNELKIIFDKNFGFEHHDFKEVIDNLQEKSTTNEDWEKVYLDIWTLEKYITSFANQNGIFNNTIHGAKGLEFDAVVLFEINEGRLPYQEYNQQTKSYIPYSPEDKENGKNLLYVGLSRPKKHLIILHSHYKSLFVDSIQVDIGTNV